MKLTSLRAVGAFACDDVRLEIGNKFTFVGIYTSDLNLPDFPCTLALRIVVLVDFPEAGPFHFAFRLMHSNGTKIAEIEGKLEAAKAGRGMLPIGPTAITFAEHGSFALQFRSAPGRWKNVHK